MTIALCTAITQARLVATLASIGPSARILIYAGERPSAGGETNSPALTEIPLANPPGAIVDGQLKLIPANSTGVLIRASGQASWARLVSVVGDTQTWLLDCDISGPSGTGDWLIAIDNFTDGIAETQLYEGGTFILGTITLG